MSVPRFMLFYNHLTSGGLIQYSCHQDTSQPEYRMDNKIKECTINSDKEWTACISAPCWTYLLDKEIESSHQTFFTTYMRDLPWCISAYEISKSTGFHMLGFEIGFLDFMVDFWISDWTFGTSEWISGIQLEICWWCMRFLSWRTPHTYTRVCKP